MTATNERRKKPRAPANFDLHLEFPGQSGSARVRDISSSGVRCESERPVPMMTQVQMRIVLPGGASDAPREIVCRGAVVRSEPITRSVSGAATVRSGAPFDIAIFFTEMRDSDREDVEAFVASSRTSRPR